MTEFIWVASYPKSGSTWMRFILAHLLFDTGGDNSLVRAMVPNIHDWEGPLKYEWDGAYPAKTHLAYHNLPERMRTQSAIYMVRNPLDMVDSSISYMASESVVDRNRVIDDFCSTGGIEPWTKLLGYCSWEENVASWTSGSHKFPSLIIRYEDLLAEPHNNIRRVAEFVGIDVDDTKIDEVYEATTFETMKAREDVEIESNATGVFTDERLFDKKEYRFMRSGKAEGYRERFSEDEITRLTQAFQSTMKALDYM